jgi:hypothetical protein
MIFEVEKIMYRDSSHSTRLLELFTQGIHTHKISFTDWYDLMTAPLDNSFTKEEEDLIVRLIYAVRQGWVKVVDEV